MGRLIKYRQLWKDGVFCQKDDAILNCDEIVGQPRQIWIDRTSGCCGQAGLNYSLKFTDPNSGNEISGVLVDTKTQGQIVIDVATVDEIPDACNACCDAADADVIAGVYDAGIPAYADPSTSTFCVSRVDDGGAYAVQKFNLDYMNRVDTIVHKSNTSGTSKYQVTAHAAPKLVGADTITAGVCS